MAEMIAASPAEADSQAAKLPALLPCLMGRLRRLGLEQVEFALRRVYITSEARLLRATPSALKADFERNGDRALPPLQREGEGERVHTRTRARARPRTLCPERA
eukprot:4203143-Prymnesium_polylepis.1